MVRKLEMRIRACFLVVTGISSSNVDAAVDVLVERVIGAGEANGGGDDEGRKLCGGLGLDERGTEDDI